MRYLFHGFNVKCGANHKTVSPKYPLVKLRGSYAGDEQKLTCKYSSASKAQGFRLKIFSMNSQEYS
jgi:hypothetical protein